MERREALASFGPTSAGVPWPFDRVRDGQSDFLVDARRSLSEGKHLLAHAPTGLGKTAVALVAALDYGLAADKLVLFLTSRQSHHRIAIETIRRIEARGLRIPTIDLIAKHSMCLQEAAPSHGRAFQEFCDFRVKSRTCSFFTRDNSAVVAAVLQRTLHVQELVRASSACRVCPHRVAMDAAAHSRLVVCDYNYVFSDIRGRFLPRLGRSLEDLILIVDEPTTCRTGSGRTSSATCRCWTSSGRRRRRARSTAKSRRNSSRWPNRSSGSSRRCGPNGSPARTNSSRWSRRASGPWAGTRIATRRSSKGSPSPAKTRSAGACRPISARSQSSSCDGGIRTRASSGSSSRGRRGSSRFGSSTRASSAGRSSTESTRAS